MSDPDEHHYQIEIPESFIALFIRPGRSKPDATRATIATRYEFCEDLASQLHDYARARHFDLDISEDEVLLRCHAGLADGSTGLGPAEAVWVIRRLAELLEWRCPPLEA